MYILSVKMRALNDEMLRDKELDTQEKWPGNQRASVSLVKDSSMRRLKIITYIFALSKYQKVRVAQFTISYTSLFSHWFRKEKTKKIVKLQSVWEKG